MPILIPPGTILLVPLPPEAFFDVPSDRQSGPPADLDGIRLVTKYTQKIPPIAKLLQGKNIPPYAHHLISFVKHLGDTSVDAAAYRTGRDIARDIMIVAALKKCCGAGYVGVLFVLDAAKYLGPHVERSIQPLQEEVLAFERPRDFWEQQYQHYQREAWLEAAPLIMLGKTWAAVGERGSEVLDFVKKVEMASEQWLGEAIKALGSAAIDLEVARIRLASDAVRAIPPLAMRGIEQADKGIRYASEFILRLLTKVPEAPKQPLPQDFFFLSNPQLCNQPLLPYAESAFFQKAVCSKTAMPESGEMANSTAPVENTISEQPLTQPTVVSRPAQSRPSESKISLSPFIRIDPGVARLGVTVSHLLPHYDLNVGVAVSEDLIRRVGTWVFSGGHQQGHIELYGERYYYEITGRNWKVGMEVYQKNKHGDKINRGCNPHHIHQFKLRDYTLASPGNKSVILKALGYGISPLVNMHFNDDLKAFLTGVNGALDNHDLSTPTRLYEAFFKKYAGNEYTGVKGYLAVQIKQNEAAIRENMILTSAPEALIDLLSNPAYQSDIAKIDARLHFFDEQAIQFQKEALAFEHATRQNAVETASEAQLKVLASEAEYAPHLERINARLQYYDAEAMHRLRMDHLARQETTYFWIQSAQIVLDSMHFALSHLRESEHPVVKKVQVVSKHAHALLVPGLQIAAHHVYWDMNTLKRTEPEPFPSMALNYARYGLLGAQVFRVGADLLDFKAVRDILDGYILPIGQLSLSAGFIAVSPDNVSAGLLSFSPELLLNIPEVRQFLLAPEPSEPHAYARFLFGMTLVQLSNNRKHFLGSLMQLPGFTVAYSETLAIWLASALHYLGGASMVPMAQECFAAFNRLYLLFRVAELGTAFIQTIQQGNEKWDEYRFAHKKDSLTSLFAKHYVSGAEIGTTPADGNCLFHAIAYYVTDDYQALRQKAVAYERAHSEDACLRKLVEGDDFEAYLQNMARDGTWGTIVEIYSLSMVLQRPIIVNGGLNFDHTPTDISKLPGDPIFIQLDNNHYQALLLRGEPYFERDYAKHLAAKRAALADVVVEEEAHQRMMNTMDRITQTTAACQETVVGIQATYTASAQSLNGINAALDRLAAFRKADAENNSYRFFSGTKLPIDNYVRLYKTVGGGVYAGAA